MYYMIILVLDHLDQCSSVLNAWDATGVGGITIWESTGLAKLKQESIRDDLPLMPSLMRILQGREESHRTLMTVVEGDEWVDRIIQATEDIVGDLNQPKNGVLFVLPVARVVGLAGAQIRAKKEG